MGDDLLYSICDKPPWFLSIFLGLQHYLCMFSGGIAVSFIIADYLCFADQPLVISEVLCTIYFTAGFVTLLQCTFGVRLPIVQSASYAYLSPLIALMEAKPQCPSSSFQAINATSNATVSTQLVGGGEEEWKLRMREIQGGIIMAALFQTTLGCFGVVSLLMRYIGPLTIAPTIMLVALPLFESAAKFGGSQWGITFVVMFFVALFSQVLHNMSFGKHKVFIFKLFPILLAIMIGWLLSYILTVTNTLKEGSAARTDHRSVVMETSLWFRVPYPGQWGIPKVTLACTLGMCAASLASIIESVGDYYACAKASGAPAPPAHALNRGLATEGVGCLITGLFGTGLGTTSVSENIGTIGITRVGSNRVMQCGGFVMIVLSVVGKFGALFISIPDPVVGGVFMITFGMIIAYGISPLQFVDLNSSRNLFIIGTSIMLGMAVPAWTKANKAEIDVGFDSINNVIRVLLMTGMLIGGVTGFVLDNMLPGTVEERGIISFQNNMSKENGGKQVDQIIYDLPLVPKSFYRRQLCQFIPILPYYPADSPEGG